MIILETENRNEQQNESRILLLNFIKMSYGIRLAYTHSKVHIEIFTLEVH